MVVKNKRRRAEDVEVHFLLFSVRLVAHVSNGEKFLVYPNSEKDTVNDKGVLS